MTNDTKAPPEQIWAWPTYSWLSGAWAQTRFPETAESYTRADLALAAQGALIERAKDVLLTKINEVSARQYWFFQEGRDEEGYRAHAAHVYLSTSLSELDAISPDATAALEAVRREAVEQERERCAALLEEKANAFPVGHENHEKGASSYNWFKTCAAAIRDTPPQET